MSTRQYLMVIVLFLFNAHSYSSDASETIKLGSVILSIGDKKEYVMEQFNRWNYDVLKTSDDQHALYLIRQSYRDELIQLGSVVFHNNKLSSVNKDWGSFESSDCGKLFSSLFSILEENDRKGITDYVIITDRVTEPNILIEYITIKSSNKRVSITYFESYGDRGVQINEILE